MNIAEGLARYLTESRKHEVPAVLREIGNAGLSLGSRVTIPYSALLAAAIMVVGHIVLQHTRFGRYVYMAGGNREAARLAGVRTHRIVIASLALCAVTAGLGGPVKVLDRQTCSASLRLPRRLASCERSSRNAGRRPIA